MACSQRTKRRGNQGKGLQKVIKIKKASAEQREGGTRGPHFWISSTGAHQPPRRVLFIKLTAQHGCHIKTATCLALASGSLHLWRGSGGGAAVGGEGQQGPELECDAPHTPNPCTPHQGGYTRGIIQGPNAWDTKGFGTHRPGIPAGAPPGPLPPGGAVSFRVLRLMLI